MKTTPYLLSFLLITCSIFANEKLLESSFRLKSVNENNELSYTSFGTAFGADLSKYGLKGKNFLLTAHHGIRGVLDIDTKIYIELKKDEWVSADVVASDPSIDLAILKVKQDVPVLKFDDHDIRTEEKVYMAGAPRGEPIQLFKGIILRRFEAGTMLTKMKIELDYGDSGAAVISVKTGKVVGLVVAGIKVDGKVEKELGLFVPLSVLVSFMEEVQKENK